MKSSCYIGTDNLWNSGEAFFRNILQLHQHKSKILRVDISAIFKITMRRIPTWSQKIEARTYPTDFLLGMFWCGVSRYAATHLSVVSFSVHSDVTRFRPWSQWRQEIFSMATKNCHYLLRRLETLKFLIRVQAFGYPFCGATTHVHIFMNNEPITLTWDAQLPRYLLS